MTLRCIYDTIQFQPDVKVSVEYTMLQDVAPTEICEGLAKHVAALGRPVWVRFHIGNCKLDF